MAALTIYINNQEIETEEGKTVLEASREAGIYIPTLCEHEFLSNWGGCRMCLVEVEPRGLLHPACTYPVSPGLRVHTHTEKVVKARKYVLQLLFSERSHYCMYCAASGECELQDLAYEHGLDHWLYSRPDLPMPIDGSRKYFLMDHNRCILCRRCVRACGEIAGVHTLAVGLRGAKSMIVADLNVPFGESTCISCGTCLQVCPTGALVDRRSAYMGREELLEATESVCFQCSVGCGITGMTRSDRLVRIESDWEAPVNHGLLCRLGRFDPMYVTASRLTAPMVRVDGKLKECSWEEALKAIAREISNAETVRCLTSTRSTNEILDVLQAGFGSNGEVALYDGNTVTEAPGEKGHLSDIEAAGALVIISADLDYEHEVVASFIRRAVDAGARLYILGDNAERLASTVITEKHLGDAGEVAQAVADLGEVLVLYGPEAEREALLPFSRIPGARFIGLPAGVNTAGAVERGVGAIAGGRCDVLYVYAADNPAGELPPLESDFLVVHSCYRTPLTEAADVVLPAMHWSEKSGSLTNLEGLVQTVRSMVTKADWVRSDDEITGIVGEYVRQRVH